MLNIGHNKTQGALNMKKILSVLLLLTLYCIIGCQSQRTPDELAYRVYPQNVDADAFNTIVLQGDAKVELLNGDGELHIAPTIKPIISLHKKILTINLPRTQPNLPVANNSFMQVYSSKLRKITTTDHSMITAKRFQAPLLTISAAQSSSINLTGEYGVDIISQHSKGKISIDWINSKNLFIDSDNSGLIYLGGVTDKMIAKLTNNARLEARYLRTKQAEIFTTNQATADILVSDYLGGYAIDNSNIYYHKKPKKITIVSRDYSNVVRPDWMR